MRLQIPRLLNSKLTRIYQVDSSQYLSTVISEKNYIFNICKTIPYLLNKKGIELHKYSGNHYNNL